MLALTRKNQESIIIDGNIEVKILEIQGDKVKIGINAPKNISIHRQEVYEQIKNANREAGNLNVANLKELSVLVKKNR